MKILIPLPQVDFDPTEAAVSWKILHGAGHQVIFATPTGSRAQGDLRMLTGKGLGIFRSFLMADKNGLRAYAEMEKSPSFNSPLKWRDLDHSEFAALLLPGGHAQGMREYLESPILHQIVAKMIACKPVGAICHGTVLAARSKRDDGKSVLWDRKTTALLKTQELFAWALTRIWLKNYYRTYPETVQDEVTRNLSSKDQFISGPLPMTRDSETQLESGFIVKDGNYLSARWPGDAHRFATEFLTMLS